MNAGGVRSSVHVTVLDAVDVLLHASFASHVLVCEREHPLLVTEPSLMDIVGAPHASVAVAVPSDALISPADGLQPSVNELPPVVITGAPKSTVHVTVLDIVTWLLHASFAVNVLVCERVHPLTIMLPSLGVIVGMPHASVAVAPSSADCTSADVGLQFRSTLA